MCEGRKDDDRDGYKHRHMQVELNDERISNCPTSKKADALSARHIQWD